MDLVIDKAEHAYALWEKEVHSLQLSLVSLGRIRFLHLQTLQTRTMPHCEMYGCLRVIYLQVKKRLFTVDEMRRAIEGLPAEAQDKVSTSPLSA